MLKELATTEKTILEEAQRKATKERMAQNETWIPHCFEFDPVLETWHYQHADVRPWDQRNDVVQYESNCIIATKTRHRTPMIREASIVSVERQSDPLRQMGGLPVSRSARDPLCSMASDFRRNSRMSSDGTAAGLRRLEGSISSSGEGDHLHSSEEDSHRVKDVSSRARRTRFPN